MRGLGYHRGHSEACRKRMGECMKDDERMAKARQRMTEYAAERIKEDEEKRRRKDEGRSIEPFNKEEPLSKEKVSQSGEQEQSKSSSSSSGVKRQREETDALEKEDVLEEEESLTRGVKRQSEVADEESASKRRLDEEHGVKRSVEEGSEMSDAIRVRIDIMEEDELHESEGVWEGETTTRLLGNN